MVSPASSCRTESITVIMRIQGHITNSRFWRPSSHQAQLLTALFLLLLIAVLWCSPLRAQHPNPDYPFLSFSPGPIPANSSDETAEGTGQESAGTNLEAVNS